MNQARAESPSPLAGERLGRGEARDRARAFRRGQADAEAILWTLLRAKRLAGWKFRRQFPIGSYIVDLACPAARLIVEADGGQHAQNAYDGQRHAWRRSQGWRVTRFWNSDIFGNAEGVLTAMTAALASPLPNPSPARGEGLFGAKHG